MFHKALLKLGFSPTEATVYITLCKHGALTGYETAKLTGISRSNVYAALYSLQEKGKCHVAEGESTKYVAISKEELLLTTKEEMTKTLSELDTYFPKSLECSEPYITIKGADNILQKIKHCILFCQSHLYIFAHTSNIELIKKELIQICTIKRVTLICESALSLHPSIICYTRHKAPQGFHMIVDTNCVLTGDIEGEHAQCLYSKNISLVRLMRESFITELDNIELKSSH